MVRERCNSSCSDWARGSDDASPASVWGRGRSKAEESVVFALSVCHHHCYKAQL